MSNITRDKKEDILAEIFSLLIEQEQSLQGILATGEQGEYALRAKQINDLLKELGTQTVTTSPNIPSLMSTTFLRKTEMALDTSTTEESFEKARRAFFETERTTPKPRASSAEFASRETPALSSDGHEVTLPRVL